MAFRRIRPRCRQRRSLASHLALACIWLAHTGNAAVPDLQALMRDCAAVRDSAARLACFEALVPAPAEEDNPAATAPAAPAAAAAATPAPVRPAVAEHAPMTEDDFGLEHKPQVSEQAVESAEVVREFTVSAARRNDFTGWTIEFDNGQVWRQVGSEPYRINVGATYSIQRASFNSFLLGNPDDSRKLRVTRVR